MLKKLLRVMLCIVFVVFCGCSHYSEQKVSEMVSAKLKNIEIGMMSDEVIEKIGLPDHIEFFSKKMDTAKVMLDYENEWFYPENLPKKLVFGSQIWYYNYKIGTEVYPGLNLYFDPKMKLIGYSCEEDVKPSEPDNSSGLSDLVNK